MEVDYGKGGGEFVEASDDDYGRFCKYVGKWLGELGLRDWTVYYYWEDNGKGGSSACVRYDVENRTADFVMGERIERCYHGGGRAIEWLALHEVLHLVMADFDWVGKAVGLLPAQKEELWEIAEHKLLARLTGVIMGERR